MSNNLNNWTGIQDPSWTPVLKNNIFLGSHYKVVPTEGYIAWEYNPLRNYRLSQPMYERDGKYYTPEELINILSTGSEPFSLYDDQNKPITDEYIISKWGEDIYRKFSEFSLKEAGELVDFITNELSFNLQHPVEILPLYSYDGSVNLILNDGLNIPRLINSRFTVTGRNTYKVIDRKGDNDTNIYDLGEQFDVDTSLFKNVNKIPKLEYLGTSSGNMKIGNYHFYFKYSDSDGNESDWVAESGLVSVFIGTSPTSVNTGIRDENSIKSVKFRLSNIDIGYSFVKVYYTRYSADINSNFVISAKKIDKNFLVNNAGTCMILITGDENETEVTLEEINSSFDVIQNAQTLCTAANRLFMANIHKNKIEYDMLSKLSLCFCPYKHEEVYSLTIDNNLTEEYSINAMNMGYYDTQYIYDKTGYWPYDLYRIGIVYILKDGSLSPVFNIRGATNLPVHKENIYKVDLLFNSYDNDGEPIYTLEEILLEIDYSEEDFMIVGGTAENENAKGVIQLSDDRYLTDGPFPINSINITANHKVINELKKYCKGFFFVRQKRIPLTLCQGLVVGLDKESRTPVLPTINGVLLDIDVNNTFIETGDYNDINYVSEGFLSHYKYKLDAIKDNSGKILLKALGAIAILAATVVVTIFTVGAGTVAMGAGLAAMVTAGATAVLSATTAIGITAGVLAGVAITSATINHFSLKVRLKRTENPDHYPLEGRHTKIPDGYERGEQEDSRLLHLDITKRYLIKDPSKIEHAAIIVPDYLVNLPYYNLFLTGTDFILKLSREQPVTNYLDDGYFISKFRHFYIDLYYPQDDIQQYNVKLVGVPDGCPVKMIGLDIYRGRAGYPEEAYKYEFYGEEYEDSVNKKQNSDIIRGNFGSYVGVSGYQGHACDQVNIMIPGYKENKLFDYIQLRMLDTSAFYAISDRFDIYNLHKEESILLENDVDVVDFDEVFYRGDSYICLFSHRIIRNFNDPSAPYNDKIIDMNTWKDNYDPDATENYANINLGDVNAVQLGLWLTFLLRSSYNLNIRTIDKSNVDEYLMCGNYRSFYPNYSQLANGSNKIPDSDQYNKGFTKSVSEKYYFEVPDVPYIKQEFQNRIVFSDIHINDAYKNGFRVFRNVNHKDYPMTYGSITKLIELKNALLIIFEHGIGIVTINNQSEHSSLILSDLLVISDVYGSLWKDSIIKTPSGIYGVDTVAKKIWRVREGELEIISDRKVQEFLNLNISLSERELTPILGIRNVKTVYNAFKHDIMFTFYDNLYGTHEKSWNLCWNEVLQMFVTFYSWIPSDMQNIDNIPFSFNRDTVKAISKIGISNHDNDFSDGVTLSNNVMNIIEEDPILDDNTGEVIYQKPTFEVANKTLKMTYLNKLGEELEYEFDDDVAGSNVTGDIVLLSSIVSRKDFIGFLHLDNRSLPESKASYYIEYELLRDRQDNYKMFEIRNIKLAVKTVNELIKSNVTYVNASYLALKNNVYTPDLLSEIYYRNKRNHSYADYDLNKIAPEPMMYTITNKKIEGTLLINKSVLDELREQYGDDWPTGFDTSYNQNTANHCGFIKDIYNNYNIKEVPENEDPKTWVDPTSLYHGIKLSQHWLLESENGYKIYTNLPIFKNRAGKRLMLPKHLQVNPDKIVRYLNIKAKVFIEAIGGGNNAQSAYYNLFVNGDHDLCMIDAGYFESQVAITTSFNLSLLSTDFWKHGLAGLIDITDKIYPTYWYGNQHPFEFECVVVDDPSIHKIFTNLELIANKTKPESFHYEIIGDAYDFSEDKPTMYFRQEALKALYQYNGYDIEYNTNFLNIEPKQHNKSADLPKYYSRWDSINEIYDSYKRFSAPMGFNYDHLSGAEVVYYPTRNEFRIWNHAQAIDVDSLSLELATSLIKANCRYLEDKWLISINPLVVTYKNEVDKIAASNNGESMFSKNSLGVYKYTTWVNGQVGNKLPPINIKGTKLEESLGNNIKFPGDNPLNPEEGNNNALYGLYDLKQWNLGDWRPIDPVKNKDRRETDIRGKFIKIRIRYSGEELAIIDFLNTIYQISFA